MERTGGEGIGRAVWWTLAGLALLRAASAFLPSMWGWGLNLQRFLPPLVAWLPWTMAVLLLHPGLAAGLALRLEHAGDLLVGRRWARWLAAAAGAALVWSLPDRTWITGDFLLRQGTAETGAFPTTFVQAMPLEVILNQWVPRMFGSLSPADPNLASRAVGALAAAGMALVAVTLASDWGWRGAAAVVGAGIVFSGGYLIAFTGLGKPAAPITLLAALTLLGAGRLARSGRGAWLLAVSLGIAFLTHRSALALAPVGVVAFILALRRREEIPQPARRRLLIAAVVPLACAALAAPIVLGIVRRHDLPHHLAPPVVMQGGPLAAALAPQHLLDLGNLLLLYTPALATAMAVLIATRPRTRPAVDTMLAVLLAGSFVPLLLFIHPMQGIFRDIDVFASAGAAVALLSARVVGTALQRRRLPSWLAPALLASVLVPACQWLIHFHNPSYGLRRVRAYAAEAPARDERDLARLWDVIAYRAFRLREWDWALEASSKSVRYAPHPRAVIMLALARTYNGDHHGAESLYVALAERTPDDPLVWLGLGGAALRVGDSVQSARALARLNAYAPEGREARLIRRHLRFFPEVWPAKAAVAGGGAGGTRR